MPGWHCANGGADHGTPPGRKTLVGCPESGEPSKWCPLWRILLGCWDLNFLPTSGFSVKPLKGLKVKNQLLAGEHKANESTRGSRIRVGPMDGTPCQSVRSTDRAFQMSAFLATLRPPLHDFHKSSWTSGITAYLFSCQ